MTLSENFQEGLLPTRKRLELEQNRESFLEGPVFITEDTCGAIRAELGMLEDRNTRNVLRGINSTLGAEPFKNGLEMTKSYFRYFKNNEDSSSAGQAGLLHQISSWLNNHFVIRGMSDVQSVLLKNVASVGIAVVINAFHRQCGPEFLDRLNKVNPQNLMQAFADPGEGNFTETLSIIERVKKSRSIPSDQVFLSTLVSQLSYESPVDEALEDGAVRMYHAIKKLWPKLKTPPPSPSK